MRRREPLVVVRVIPVVAVRVERQDLAEAVMSVTAHARIHHILVLLDESGQVTDTKTLNHTKFMEQKALQAADDQVLAEPEDVEKEDGQEIRAPDSRRVTAPTREREERRDGCQSCLP